MSCDTCACIARYTTATGARACSLCSMSVAAVRDIDLPDLLGKLSDLLTVLDQQGVSAGASVRMQLWYLIGRRLPEGEKP